MFRKIIFQLFMLLLVFALVSCGDGSVELSYEGPTINVPDYPSTTNQLPTAVASIGPMSWLSKMIVNEVVYDTSAAGVTINGETGVLDDLLIGYVVTVNGTLDAAWETGSADLISFNANVVGPIESIDPIGRHLLIMGQSVRIDTDTRYVPPLDSNSLSSLMAGTAVQISGLPDANGEIVVTHMKVSAEQQHFQVIGTVSEINFGELIFKINELTVDYSSAVVLDLPGGAPSNAMEVLARGTLSPNGVFQVSELTTNVKPSEFATDSRIEITGYITRYNSDSDFFINGLRVTTDLRTIFYYGMHNDLTLGARVQVNGRWNGSGKLRAQEIWFEQ
ncbi:MAG: hypothetical protein KZQ90_08685 [Candidatus Thiodiazotropha sp. (ex Codakia rugifera)]|nr:hypothetical protein [Candidatus Thiodiazotropha sp. (ex Codakia rugifera)]